MLERQPRGPTSLDYSIAAGAAVVELAHAAVLDRSLPAENLTPLGIALLLGQTLPIAWRWRHPVLVATCCGILAGVLSVTTDPDPFPLGPLIAFGTLISVLRLRPAIAVGALTLLAATIINLVSGFDAANDFDAILLISLTWMIGAHLQLREEYVNEVVARNARLEADRLAALERAVADERSRIARDLHDVVAHSVTSMVVKTEAVAARAEQTGELDAIADTGRAALVELRRLFGVLRSDAEAPRDPQPSLLDLNALVSPLRDAGIRVEVRSEGDVAALDPSRSLCAYRIIQEATTNVLRHASAANALIETDVHDHQLTISVRDDGDGRPDHASPAGGYGLVGMAERIGLFGGTLETKTEAAGGFSVTATIPLGQP